MAVAKLLSSDQKRVSDATCLVNKLEERVLCQQRLRIILQLRHCVFPPKRRWSQLVTGRHDPIVVQIKTLMSHVVLCSSCCLAQMSACVFKLVLCLSAPAAKVNCLDMARSELPDMQCGTQ